ncbi:hypothetical protein SS50377_26777 [Spironucleus salmonicida]|uniref:Uncharacterized protein n=1 Tax=Spironucleus salmonicida TaxID=348837 RepID=V6LZR9_9EUKA|nr:hypothetical protein SS50377_26777 [Spironucleus salmonicida]|eukprot:EST49246.1 Hypothetical protein SS50377_10466 [Spironucleus salmonicida]
MDWPKQYVDGLEYYNIKQTDMELFLYDQLIFDKFFNQHEIREILSPMTNQLSDLQQFKSDLQVEYQLYKLLKKKSELVQILQNHVNIFLQKYHQTAKEFDLILGNNKDFNLLINSNKIKQLLSNANAIDNLYYDGSGLLILLQSQPNPYRFWLELLNKGLQIPKIGQLDLDYDYLMQQYYPQLSLIHDMNLRFSDNFIIDALFLSNGDTEIAINKLYELFQ